MNTNVLTTDAYPCLMDTITKVSDYANATSELNIDKSQTIVLILFGLIVLAMLSMDNIRNQNK